MVHALTATTVVSATKLFVIFGGLKANRLKHFSKAELTKLNFILHKLLELIVQNDVQMRPSILPPNR